MLRSGRYQEVIGTRFDAPALTAKRLTNSCAGFSHLLCHIQDGYGDSESSQFFCCSNRLAVSQCALEGFQIRNHTMNRLSEVRLSTSEIASGTSFKWSIVQSESFK